MVDPFWIEREQLYCVVRSPCLLPICKFFFFGPFCINICCRHESNKYRTSLSVFNPLLEWISMSIQKSIVQVVQTLMIVSYKPIAGNPLEMDSEIQDISIMGIIFV